jgi:hypothetical protein
VRGQGGVDFCFSLVPNVFPWGSHRVPRVPKLFQNLGADLFLIFDWGSKEVLLFGSAHMGLPKKKEKKV